MQTRIKATAVSHGDDGLKKGSVSHAVTAAENCIIESGLNKDDIGLLINIGIYRDDNAVEPSMAAFIQQQLGLNLDPATSATARSSFSFDLMNGACGFVYAAQVVDTFIKNGLIKYALVVSGDVHPSKGIADDFPFKHVATAVLFEGVNEVDKGFLGFHFKTSGDGDEKNGLESYIDMQAGFPESKRQVTLTTEDDYCAGLQAFSAGHIRSLREEGRVPATVVVIASHPEKGFGRNVVLSMGPSRVAVIDLFDRYGDTHTSALSLAYHVGLKEGLLKENDQVLFAGAGSGLTSACALYAI